MKKTVHIISHSHWDREWYLPFEQFRIRLVDLIDRTLDLLESETSGFHYFHMDGHVLLVDDYLQIKPEQEERVRRLVQAGKLFIGPWYVLQDAFLTSGEAQARNLQYGIRRAKELGGVTMVGYFPDTFGNISQAPQLLHEFGIDNAVFGRGINAIAEENKVQNQGREGYHSELCWESPDGSRVISVFLANWYHNGMELPVEISEASGRAPVLLANVERFAATDQLLLMNGCDHQPVQSDVGKAIETLQAVKPGYRFIHSNFPQYMASIQQQSNKLQTVTGELTSQLTDGWTTLVNTASSRLYLKQWNCKVQRELERWVEPFTAIAWMLGDEYPAGFVRQAWLQLLQNHPHDSICGCSLDEVHEEMVIRFKKAWQISETLSLKALQSIAERIDTAAWVDLLGVTQSSPKAYPIVVFNPLPRLRNEWVEVDVDSAMELSLHQFVLLNEAGLEVTCEIKDQGWVQGFTLPDDRFRIPWKKRRYSLRFWAKLVPGLGHRSFLWISRDQLATQPLLERLDQPIEQTFCRLADQQAIIENSYLSLLVDYDGSIMMTNKTNGKVYRDLLVLENTGDTGNEYTYIQAEGAVTITTKGVKALLEDVSTPTEARLRITHRMLLPVSRQGRARANQLLEQPVELIISLSPEANRAVFELKLHNLVRDQRLRVLFPTDLETDDVYADAPFDVVKRAVKPWDGWTNPARCERMQNFVDISDGDDGVMVITEGLPEYEVLRDGRNTIAVTLLRSVGEIGDWNYFPTPEAQCLGPFRAQFAIVAHQGMYHEALREPVELLSPLRAVTTGVHAGSLKPSASWLTLKPSAETMWFSSMKKAETFEGIQFRFVNTGNLPVKVDMEGLLVDVRANGIVETMMNEHVLESGGDPRAKQWPSKKICSIGVRLS